jgi:hypothetical protein
MRSSGQDEASPESFEGISGRPTSDGLQYYGLARIDGETGVMTVSLYDISGAALFKVAPQAIYRPGERTTAWLKPKARAGGDVAHDGLEREAVEIGAQNPGGKRLGRPPGDLQHRRVGRR